MKITVGGENSSDLEISAEALAEDLKAATFDQPAEMSQQTLDMIHSVYQELALILTAIDAARHRGKIKLVGQEFIGQPEWTVKLPQLGVSNELMDSLRDARCRLREEELRSDGYSESKIAETVNYSADHFLNCTGSSRREKARYRTLDGDQKALFRNLKRLQGKFNGSYQVKENDYRKLFLPVESKDVSSYELIHECYLRDVLRELYPESEKAEIAAAVEPITLNLFQVEYLAKQNLLEQGTYIFFNTFNSMINVVYLEVKEGGSYYRRLHNKERLGYLGGSWLWTSKLSQGTKLLLRV